MQVSRRKLLAGGSAAGLFASVGPGVNVAFGAPGDRDVLVVIFQRGAADWLQMLAPAGR